MNRAAILIILSITIGLTMAAPGCGSSGSGGGVATPGGTGTGTGTGTGSGTGPNLPPTDSWETVNSGTSNNLNSISFASATAGWAVGEHDTLLSTTDGGDSWISQFSNITGSIVNYSISGQSHIVSPYEPTPDGSAYFLAVDAASPTAAWVTCYNPCLGLEDFGSSHGRTPCLLTNDGGGSWTRLAAATNFQIWGVHAFDGQDAAICTIGADDHPDSDVYVMKGGVCRERILLRWAGLYAISFGDRSSGWTVGADILRSADGGSSWNEQTKPGGVNQLYGVDAVDANTAFACGTGGKIIKTTDGGASWSVLDSGVSVKLRDIEFADSNTGWCVGEGGTILRTTDGGATWTAMDSGTTSHTLMSVSVVDAAHVWVCGSSGLVLRSK